MSYLDSVSTFHDPLLRVLMQTDRLFEGDVTITITPQAEEMTRPVTGVTITPEKPTLATYAAPTISSLSTLPRQ